MTYLSRIDQTGATQPDAKAAGILKAGLEAFQQFGLRRTSMKDIADRAGISRAALYLHFRNKDDIFGKVIAGYQHRTMIAVQLALDSHHDPARALAAAFEAQVGNVGEALLRSPHSDELLAEHAIRNTDQIAQIYARWIDAGIVAGRISPDAVTGNSVRTARVMLAGFEGLKGLSSDWQSYVDARRQLARIYARALTV